LSVLNPCPDLGAVGSAGWRQDRAGADGVAFARISQPERRASAAGWVHLVYRLAFRAGLAYSNSVFSVEATGRSDA